MSVVHAGREERLPSRSVPEVDRSSRRRVRFVRLKNRADRRFQQRLKPRDTFSGNIENRMGRGPLEYSYWRKKITDEVKYLTREDLAYAERVAALEVQTAEFKQFSQSAEKRYERFQQFTFRVIIGVMLVVGIAFYTAARNSLDVNASLANLTVKVGNIERDITSLKSDVAFLKENAVLKTDTEFIKQQVYEVLDETGLLQLVASER